MNPDLHYKLCASYFVTRQSYCCGHGVLLQCIHSSVVNNMYTHVHVVSYFVSLLQPTPNVCQLTMCLQLGCGIMMLCWVQLVCCYGIVTGELNTTNSALEMCLKCHNAIMSTFKHITHFTCYMSHVICYMPQVIWYMSHVSCCTSYVIYCMLEMPCILLWFHPNISHMSTCHMLHVTCHMSHVTSHMLHVTCHMLHVASYMSYVARHMSYIAY